MNNPSPFDQAIAEIASGHADDRTLHRFEALAGDSAANWKRLALSLCDELEMRRELDQQLDGRRQIAELEINRARDTCTQRPSPRSMRWSAWSGWSVAAVLLLTFVLIMTVQSPHPESQPDHRAVPASFTAQAALEDYVTRGAAEGRVLAELPTVMVESRELDDGTLEVLYLRQFLERERVDEVYTVASDELGQPQPLKIDASQWPTSDAPL